MANSNDTIPGDTGLTVGTYTPPDTPNHPGAGGPDASLNGGPLAPFIQSLTAPFAFLGVLSRQDFWVRVGIGFLGFGLVVTGVWILVISNKEVQAAVSGIAETAVKATPQGAATSAIVGAVS